MSAEVPEPEPSDSPALDGPSYRTRSRSDWFDSVSSETSSFSSIDSEERGQRRGTAETGRPREHVPETPNVSRKRVAPMESSTMRKSSRLSGRAPNQACKVLFTGVAAETGGKVWSRLGGGLARDVWDMTYLVTDRVRRTVKFLCAMARGIPIVNTQWLRTCGKVRSCLPPSGFIVKDTEQELKFNFCLQESLRTASNQPLLQGYEIHVTKSVQPEPVYMKDIILCSGAKYLPKMPSKHKAHTVVVSCEEDWALCGPAVSASLPTVTAEFILTGVLQQKVGLETHVLSISAANTWQAPLQEEDMSAM